MKTTIKLHVDPDDGSWRARIDPQDAGRWFRSYGSILVHLADMVESSGGSRLSIGCELAGTLGHADEWRGLIRAVRAHFTGRLSYAASWDEAALVPFWGDLDEVGVDCYYPVTVRDRAGGLDALAGWAPVIARLQRLHNQTGRDILLTEIGYRSVDGGGRHPYEYGSEGPVDLQEQADLYWAALHATSGPDWLSGLYWWNWAADGSGGPFNTDYTPSGKPAEELLRSAWRE
jgi:hypothetical protein